MMPDLLFLAALTVAFIVLIIIHNRATRQASKQIEKGFAAYVMIVETAQAIRNHQVSKIINP